MLGRHQFNMYYQDGGYQDAGYYQGANYYQVAVESQLSRS